MNYLLAHMIDKPEVGSKMRALPLHMTVVHWFLYDGPLAELTKACERVAYPTEAFVAKTGADDKFGKDHDVPVSRVEMSADIRELHNSFLEALGKIGVEHTELQWTGDGFNAHVTHKENRRLYKGDEFPVDSVDLFSAESLQSERTLVARFPFRIS